VLPGLVYSLRNVASEPAGYAFAFGSTAGGFIGKDTGNFALHDVLPGTQGWDRFFWTCGELRLAAFGVSHRIWGSESLESSLPPWASGK